MSEFVNTVDSAGDEVLANSIIVRNITEIACNLTTSIGDSAFYNCSGLTTLDFPNVTSIGASAFYNCSKLTSVDFPNVTSIGASAFSRCSGLTTLDFPNVTSIGASAFYNCSKLTTMILRNAENIPKLAYRGGIQYTPIASGTGYIYVPSALVDSYKADSDWSNYADQFRALEDYTVDGTVTGELDSSKI